MKRFQTVSALQAHLKKSIVDSVESRLVEICYKVVEKNILDRVYRAYIPKGEYAYDRTYELMDSLTIDNISVENKCVTFEIFMDASKIKPYETGDGEWNQHQSMPTDSTPSYDVSEYIPQWIEEGTSGSLWDREGAHYMEQSWIELDIGTNNLAKELENALRAEGWDVKFI